MRRSLAWFFLATAFLGVRLGWAQDAVPAAGGEDAKGGYVSFAPKLSFRLSSGLLLNAGQVGGGMLTLGGLNLTYTHYFDATWALGGGYRADFDYQRGILPLSGVMAYGRWYFHGMGTRASKNGDRIASKVLDDFALYVGPQIGYSAYFLGINPWDENQTDVLEGTFFTIEGVLGFDYRLSKKLELNFEGSMAMLTFSHSDERYRIRSFLFTTGISYLW